MKYLDEYNRVKTKYFFSFSSALRKPSMWIAFAGGDRSLFNTFHHYNDYLTFNAEPYGLKFIIRTI